MRTLYDLWEEAKADHESLSLDFRGEEARLLSGSKIKFDRATEHIVIVNTTVGGNYYRPCNLEEMQVFFENGWVCGSYVLSLSNIRSKLEVIERMIHKEVNGRNNPKHMSRLKNARANAMMQYRLFSNKLKSLNNEH